MVCVRSMCVIHVMRISWSSPCVATVLLAVDISPHAFLPASASRAVRATFHAFMLSKDVPSMFATMLSQVGEGLAHPMEKPCAPSTLETLRRCVLKAIVPSRVLWKTSANSVLSVAFHARNSTDVELPRKSPCASCVSHQLTRTLKCRRHSPDPLPLRLSPSIAVIHVAMCFQQVQQT